MCDKQTFPSDKAQAEPDGLHKSIRAMQMGARTEPVPQNLRDAAIALGDALDALRAAGTGTKPRKPPVK
ncbi:hypothetical protein [Pseudotabrizicola sp. 4114]|uniref:hypothetical protein n=1 Tax=Pseudotabrizicola sp. 4114 TaxID=2817731 RepID=UPI00285E89A6|nr:hypothetical protein [Pseudorhodobacter sp. 4114]